MSATEDLWACAEQVRDRTPLVHNMTNFVAMNAVANTLLAFGAAPAMVHAVDEVEEFLGRADALVINLGTLDSTWAAAMKLAAHEATAAGKPWVLDPVGIGVTAFRLRTGQNLVDLGPTVVRANASEILALASDGATHGRGVDSTDSVGAAEQAALALARRTGGIVAVTGDVDLVTDGSRTLRIANGHPLMARVTALGCCLSGLTGAFVAVGENTLTATAAALAVFAIAGERATDRAQGPGSLAVHLLDELYRLDEAVFLDRVRLE